MRARSVAAWPALRRTVLAAGLVMATMAAGVVPAAGLTQASQPPSGLDVRAGCPQPGAAGPVASTGPAASAAPGPAAVASPGASAAPRGFAPDATIPPGVLQWPASVVGSALALVSTDGELRKAAADWAGGIEAQDLDRLLSGVQGLAQLADEAIPFSRDLQIWPTLTQQAGTLEAAYCGISAAAHAVADAMLAGDAPAFQAASPALAEAMRVYGGLRETLMTMGDLAVLMQRGLNQ